MIIGILKKAGAAKELTGIGQEKEIVALAYNSALAKKVGNGDSTAVTAGNLNPELTNQGASATDGSNLIMVTFTASKRQYTINTNGEITYAGIKNNENSNIQLSITTTETESRAVIIKVTAPESAPTEDEFNSYSESKKQEMFVTASNIYWDDTTTWENEQELYGVDVTAEGAFEGNVNDGAIDGEKYSSLYDFIIKNASCLTATFTCTGNEPVTGTSAEFIVTNPNPTITATVSNNGGYTEKVWNEYPDAKKETFSEIQQYNTVVQQDDGYAIVPAGFAYGTSSNVGTISKGLVITDSIDENGYSNGNEFVWIPIDVASLNPQGKSDVSMAKKTSGKDINGNDNYSGNLYKFYNADLVRRRATMHKWFRYEESNNLWF